MAPKSESKGAPAGEEEAAPVKAAAPASSGIKPWIPLIANLILMPVMAYVTVVYVLPKHLNNGSAPPAVKGEAPVKARAALDKKESSSKPTVPLNDKVLVNLAGSQGTRYLLAKINLVGAPDKVGTVEEFKKTIEDHNAELVDAAMSTLRTKTITDLEKPGAINLIRAQLISSFNDILGPGTIDGILLTEFAIQ